MPDASSRVVLGGVFGAAGQHHSPTNFAAGSIPGFNEHF